MRRKRRKKIFYKNTMNGKYSWSYLPNPSARAGYDTRSIFKRSLTGFNSEFSFSYTSFLTKAEEPSLSYYLSIVGGRIIGFIPFPRVLVLCEMQSVRSRIWTRVAVSISCDDNHYNTGTSCLHHGHLLLDKRKILLICDIPLRQPRIHELLKTNTIHGPWFI